MIKAAHILIVLIIISSLINNDYFGNATLAAYFFYTITASTLTIFTSIILIKNKERITVQNKIPVLLFALLAFYCLLNGLFISSNGISTMHIFYITNFLLFFSLVILIEYGYVNINLIYNCIVALACIESAICILQFFGWLKSQNQYLPVSGSWVNPNVTAMFLSMAIPATVAQLTGNYKTSIRKMATLAIAMIVTALILLKCRTAIIGGTVAALVVLNGKYSPLQIVKAKYTTARQVLLLIAVIVVSIFAGLYLYKAKQSSADGRKLVWKIAMNMFTEKPLTGAGYGMFEHDYNLQQAAYFAAGKGSVQEINSASFVKMAYNEFLQNVVEGGLIGFALFVLLLVSLLISGVKNKQQNLNNDSVIAGVAAFIVMGIFNFTFQAIPALCLFIIYAAITCSFNKENISKPVFAISEYQKLKIAISIALIISGTLLFITQVSNSNGFANIKSASILIHEHNYSEAEQILKAEPIKIKNIDTYNIEYGRLLFQQKKYNEAAEKFSKALNTTSSPALYMQLGNSFYKQKKYDSALTAYTIAKNIVPNRLKPRYGLMKIYQRMNDTASTKKIANEIVVMQPKGMSKNAAFYKEQANAILEDDKN